MAETDTQTERAAVIKYLRAKQNEHEKSFQIARSNGDDAAMDRCAARSRTCGWLAQDIEQGLHVDG